MSVKIELGFTAAGVGAPFFTIGDATKGVIGNSDYVIGGGEALIDVSTWFKSFTISRGKGRELERFDAGRATVQFNNRNRFFDPTYTSSPYYGQIVPKRTVRISVDNIVVYTGVVDDWNIDYDPSGNSTATLTASDYFTILANNTFTNFSSPEELSGARIAAALDNINWSATLRDIDAGNENVVSQGTVTGTNALEYLNQVELSEIGFLFIDKTGKVRFVNRNGAFGDALVSLTDDGTGIPYTNIQVTYGSEFLYNRITNTSPAGTAIAEDDLSQATYGISDYQLNGLNVSSRLSPIAGALLTKYSEPEYRIESITVKLDTLSQADKDDLLALELGDIISVTFTPSGIPPAISNLSRIIGIDQTINLTDNFITVHLSSIQGAPFVIGSPVFGIIGQGTIGF